MADDLEYVIDEESMEKIDYVSLGKILKQVRTSANNGKGMTQAEAAEIFHVSRTVYTKYENGTVKPSREGLQAFAEKFNINFEELNKKISVVIPDTCALLKNKRLLHMLLEDYDKVVIPFTVVNELSYRKNQKNTSKERATAKAAWQVMANIDYYCVEYPNQISRVDNEGYKTPDDVENKRNIINDHKVMALARDLAKKTIGDVIIIHDDVDFTVYEGKQIRIDDYVAKRSALNTDYTSILDLDMEFDHLEYYQKVVKNLDLNAYLPNGMTLLISAIKCNDRDAIDERGRRIPAQKVIKKVKFLLENGADPNKNDNGRYCLPPLAHCIQVPNEEHYGYDLFKLLLENGCDFNKASRDERTASYLKVGKLNEGNTPLMIACFHAKKKFVYDLCEQEGISLNQQDSNGYTALIKTAVQRYNRKKKSQQVRINEEIYKYLLDQGADPLIRDRNNHTADDWMKRGDDHSYKENEQW